MPDREIRTARALRRRYPIGAELHDGAVHFRVWAPAAERVGVQFQDGQAVQLNEEVRGYWSVLVDDVAAGSRYSLLVDGRGPFPDPASRFQPEGPHGPSQIIDPGTFPWTDAAWQGVPHHQLIIYEMHIGTFTEEGTWRSAIAQLPDLVETGITMIEVMPIADFTGEFGWGYDGVDLFAPTRLYGTPDDMRAFVDRAHALGIGVILDVVYNHIGPDGNYLGEFSPAYISTRYQNEWGEPINFDGADSQPVREFFKTNAAYWIDEFHLDGLRLDATQQIFDASSRNIMAEIAEAVRSAAAERITFVVAENETQDAKLLHSAEAGGYELDALWNDDFHHSAVVAAIGFREAYYSDYRGTPQELLSAIKYGFLFQGQYYSWQQQNRGTQTWRLKPGRFVQYLENHDQIANTARGLPLHCVTAPGTWRALTSLLLLAPQTPMLFQGQEFASTAPFLYFADHEPELAAAVERGRAKFMSQFPSVAAAQEFLPQPHDPMTYQSCKLDHRERKLHPEAVALHRDLIALRKADALFSRPDSYRLDGAVIENEAFVLRFFGETEERLLVINLGSMLRLSSIAEPLVAAAGSGGWTQLWSSEDVKYGGNGAAPLIRADAWVIPAQSATVLQSGAL